MGRPATTPEAFWTKVARGADDACWPWLGAKTDSGYGALSYRNQWSRAHRVAWALATGAPVPAKCLVMHKCDNPPCCNPAHLQLGTDQENRDDSAAKLRGPSKLAPDDIRVIRAAAAAGEATRSLAARYNVRPFTIRCVIQRRTWTHILP